MAYTSPQVSELLAQRNALEKQLSEAREKEARLALIEIVQKMREYGISLHDLIGRKSAPEPVQPEGAAKYRDPLTGATWSGRGRAPHWIAGKDREAYLVSERADAEATAGSQASLFPGVD
ncbi:histone family protein nucleoid-structuring protein H-NS [Caballeronia arationis]|jgi:DNA-binding protein H-NS|uniref:DNA-binding protein H-NS n=1 Tax=Caballeronia arationis TaxID=1777142 RepID=A0A7Z7I5U2_9BURK|nr:H-NS histone family protein [Caballeronia arationis]SAK99647.1 histone family protein nucleoid-structuring protein H-NS [Caballeronia arationis]SOE64961.1 DNA-binding protein H-NS [Caballeronia arationis]